MHYLLFVLLLPSSLLAQSLPASAPASTPTSTPAPSSQPSASIPAETSSESQADALLWDMKHLVRVAQSAGWKIDKYEVEKLMPDALQSACQVSEGGRAAAQTKLSAEIAAKGGLVEALYQKDPRLNKLRKQLTLDRTQQLLEESSARAKGECPFYLQPKDDFQSLQGTDHRFLFVVESEGSVQIEKRGGQLLYGGGGFGRLLFGKGLDKASILGGIELAGSGLLALGAPANAFEVRYYTAFPVLVRWSNINWQYDVETAPVLMFDDTDFRVSYGLRGMVAIGVQSHRRQVFIPWGSVSLGIDHFFEGVRPTTELIHAGFRAGFTFN